MAIQFRRDTEAMWDYLNPILLQGEPGVTTNTNPLRLKIGDGVKRWKDLPWSNLSAAEVTAMLQAYQPLEGVTDFLAIYQLNS